MLEQERLIARVREVCEADTRLVAALTYGSWARGEGDPFSDVDIALFFRDDALPSIDQQEWVSRVAPTLLAFTNDYGILAVVFERGLIRGEFHFDAAADIPSVETWGESDYFPSSSIKAAILLDRSGDLTRALAKIAGPQPERDTPERVRLLIDGFLNWHLFGATVLARGEQARAHELLGHVGRYLLWMARLQERSTDHWPTPSRSLERDLSPAAYARLRACTASLDREALQRAYAEAWSWGKQLVATLAARHTLDPRTALTEAMDERLSHSDRRPGDASR